MIPFVLGFAAGCSFCVVGYGVWWIFVDAREDKKED
jgi:hypothetical protein